MPYLRYKKVSLNLSHALKTVQCSEKNRDVRTGKVGANLQPLGTLFDNFFHAVLTHGNYGNKRCYCQRLR